MEREDNTETVICEAREIASAFVAARMSGAAIGHYPGTPPHDLASAYAIQDAALAIWERAVGGWKVGRINPPRDAELGADRLVGPAFTDAILPADPARPFPVFRGGFAAAEAEFMLRLAPKEGPLPTTPAEAMAWVAEVRIGIEIASSPYARINADGPCVTISDHGNNAGLLLGQVVPREMWDTLDAVQATLAIDGAEVGRATTATMLDGPFGAVAFLLANLAGRGIAIQPGWWVSSGAITGVHVVAPGSSVVAGFGALGSVEATIG
ncbi:2-keto-4-pentenoate hydratase [Erythrobacter oryzae]|uniref:2-keto-4-pentenoate hydratase n=1 Tax=Erythrobacter oryzae TaxID=3019556 RepID=UPI00255686AB|nr:fumarylacetoacetate hydrolase family protein [Erythrobacter sp. COR-2]